MTEEYKNKMCGKNILVTGGGGSIGQALCRKIAEADPAMLIIFDIAENGVFDIEQELKCKHTGLNFECVIGSVRDKARLDSVFRRYSPDIVCHAAAHKHVPLMERSPGEAVKNNVFGTLNTAVAAAESGCERFVLISTDKAVEPASVMGATKRICEILMASLNGKYSTSFTTVRFGNVIGTNGSVIPLFRRQIEAGGPVTVTHKDAERYFMTPEEAVSLVIAAGVSARGGEIFILDMGEPHNVDRMARELIESYGLVPEKDIGIVYTGLREGEKLMEKLVRSGENIKESGKRGIYETENLPFESYTEDRFYELLGKLKESAENNTDNIREIIAQIVEDYTY